MRLLLLSGRVGERSRESVKVDQKATMIGCDFSDWKNHTQMHV